MKTERTGFLAAITHPIGAIVIIGITAAVVATVGSLLRWW